MTPAAPGMTAMLMRQRRAFQVMRRQARSLRRGEVIFVIRYFSTASATPHAAF
jgi:hypothetical protein